jgi:hypothetical protein
MACHTHRLTERCRNSAIKFSLKFIEVTMTSFFASATGHCLPGRHKLALLAATMMLALSACSDQNSHTDIAHQAGADVGGIEIRTLSNRADLVSGGDVLIELIIPSGINAPLQVSVNGRDVSAAFMERADGRIQGLLTGLQDGDNRVHAMAGSVMTDLIIRNHPRGGPVFSGAQVEPWICATVTAAAGDADTPFTTASGLGTEAIDAQCNIAAEVQHYYRTSEACGPNPDNPRNPIPCFRPLPGGPLPADVAQTTDQHGNSIPYIVRVERGTLNRGIYDIAVLDVPGTEWGPFTEQSTWNGRLVHIFGGSTGTPKRQLAPNSNWANETALSRGFMVSVSNLTDQGLNSNKVVAAETLMMIQEHIAERYGRIQHTIGSGCSGGAIMQLVIAATYPGLLDGIQPACTYPDSHTTSLEVGDCVMLEHYFGSEEFARLNADLSEAQLNRKKAAIAGHMDELACGAWSRSFGHSNNPGNFERTPGAAMMNNCMLPTNWVYDAVSNPDGVRCSQPDHEVSLWGLAPGENYARRFQDNVGIQYGLAAMEQGDISVEDFLSLNASIGGSDIDRGFTPERMRADADTMAMAYRMGMVADARQWAKTPIIDLRGNDNSGIHMNWRAWAVRDRLDRALGHHDNQVIWRYGPGLGAPAGSTIAEDALLAMDAWISAIKADTSSLSAEEKVVRNRPAEVFDFCYIGDDYQTKITDQAICDADPVLAVFSSPRQVAGGPQAEDILKCQLKALNRSDYKVSFSDEQWARMQSIFSEGVCDWSKPGVGVQPAVPWLNFSQGPGGVAM